jgi:hypothetical protein
VVCAGCCPLALAGPLPCIAGLVIGALLHGIIGPEIIELCQSFMGKMMALIPPGEPRVEEEAARRVCFYRPRPNTSEVDSCHLLSLLFTQSCGKCW